MKFSIITPSFNQLAYLKRCVASIRDQVSDVELKRPAGLVENVEPAQGTSLNDLNGFNDLNATVSVAVEHIVMDGGSTDGTVEFLREAISRQASTDNYQLSFVSEADEGMYDALNKGFDRTSGDVFAWLNCDEQYFSRTLEKVAQDFKDREHIDIVYGDTLLITPNGELLTFRKNPPLRRSYILADHLYVQSAALFFRAAIFESGLRFNTAWNAVGDCDFVIRALDAGFRSRQILDYLAACTMTGENMSRKQTGVEELRAFRRKAPPQYRLGRPAFNLLRYLEKAARQGYRQSIPLEYDIYLNDSNVRKHFVARTANFRFRWDADE